MNEHIIYILSMAISGGIFMTQSIKKNWCVIFWKRVNKRISSTWNVVLWFIGSVVLQLIIQSIVEILTVNSFAIKSFTGISMGISLSLIPFIKGKRD